MRSQSSKQWQRTLASIASIHFHISIKEEWEVVVSSKLRPNKPSIHPWTSPSGHYRKATLKHASSGYQREFLIYFGPWSVRKNPHYVAILDQRRPILEVPLKTGASNLTHSLSFPGMRKFDPRKLHQEALRLARKSGLATDGEKVRLSSQGLGGVLTGHQAANTLRDIITLAYVKEYAKKWSPFHQLIARDLPLFKLKQLKGGGKGKRTIELDLEKRYGSLRRHEELIHLLRGKLIGGGYEICEYRPGGADIDLPAQKGQTLYVFEVKAWKPSFEVNAARHVCGQLHWYMWSISQHKKNQGLMGCAAFYHRPSSKVVAFLEKNRNICIVWKSGDSLGGGPRTRSVFPEIF